MPPARRTRRDSAALICSFSRMAFITSRPWAEYANLTFLRWRESRGFALRSGSPARALRRKTLCTRGPRGERASGCLAPLRGARHDIEERSPPPQCHSERAPSRRRRGRRAGIPQARLSLTPRHCPERTRRTTAQPPDSAAGASASVSPAGRTTRSRRPARHRRPAGRCIRGARAAAGSPRGNCRGRRSRPGES